MNSITVANALAKCVPLVTIAFLQDYLNCLNSKQALPNPKNYVPPMKESNVNAIDVSLSVNPARRHVFDGKKALFTLPRNELLYQPGQLKKLKSWGLFWSYQLNSTANLVHLPRNRAKWAELALLFSW